MDLISVVIAVYNAENTLKKCVDSILAQTYKDFEIILVNDCSKDGSFAICEDYSKHHDNIVTITNKNNMGVSVTRNNGIERSNGKYICFVDSDDYVEPDYLEKLYTYYQKYNTVPICGFVYHDEFGNQPPREYKWSGGDEIVSLGKAFQLSSELYLTALWNKIFDCEAIKKHNIRFDQTLSMGEDLKFTLEYFQKCELDCVFAFCDTLYHYTRLSNNTLMSEFGSRDIFQSIELSKLIRDLAIKYNPNADEELENAIVETKNTYTYSVLRDKRISWKQQYQKIKTYEPNYSIVEFLSGKLIMVKEKIRAVICKK